MSAVKREMNVVTWKIDNFSISAIENERERGRDFLCSPTFDSARWNTYRFCLRLYPKQNSATVKQFILCSLEAVNKGHVYQVPTRMTLEIIGGNGKILKKEENNLIDPYKTTGIKCEILEIDQFKDKENTFILRCHFYDIMSEQTSHWKVVGFSTGLEVKQSSYELEAYNKERKFNEMLTIAIYNCFEMNIYRSEKKLKIDFAQKSADWNGSIKTDLTIRTDLYGSDYFTEEFTHSFTGCEAWQFPPDAISKIIDRCSELSSNRKIFSSIDLIFKFSCDKVAKSEADNIAAKYCKTIVGSNTESSDETDTNSKKPFTLQDDMRCLLLNKILTDVKLRVNGQIIEAHRAILSARSSVFSAMFHQNMSESNTVIVNIDDIDYNTMKLFLQFIYTDDLNDIDYHGAKNLMMCAEKYEVPLLKEKCSNFLKTVISEETV